MDSKTDPGCVMMPIYSRYAGQTIAEVASDHEGLLILKMYATSTVLPGRNECTDAIRSFLKQCGEL